MPIRFATLASGSKGNCAIVERAGRCLLIDIGLAPSSFLGRLRRANLDLAAISEVVLTHTHGDHINDRSLELLAAHGIVLRCHASHAAALATKPGFATMASRSLVIPYDEHPFATFMGLSIHPVRVRHGAGRTYGFRITCDDRAAGTRADLGYVADLGCWNERTAAHFRNCAILAVEFNHDVRMTHESPRHYMVKMRNLSNDGHLSNMQARDFVRAIISKSDRIRPSQLVLLHISEDCNTTELAETAARDALDCSGAVSARVFAAPQREPLPWLALTVPNDASFDVPASRIESPAGPQRIFPDAMTQQEFRFPA